MHLEHLWLRDFRNYRDAELAPPPSGVTAVVGANGEGKTNLLEAVAYLASLRSMRGAPTVALVREGSETGVAVVRAAYGREGRRLTVEAELTSSGTGRVQLNGKQVRRSMDLREALTVTLFSAGDLEIVKGGPKGRRDYLDGLLEVLDARHQATISDVDRVLKQRSALLQSAGPAVAAGRAPAELDRTLDVWDAKLAVCGEALAAARASLVGALEPLVERAYFEMAGSPDHRVRLRYQRSWEGGLEQALLLSRRDDLRRGTTSVGPHRDEMEAEIGGLAARSHRSQGEQRCLALALRLAGHRLVTERLGTAPVLLLDDVFSELDTHRSEALAATLPAGQVLLTSAAGLPAGVEPAAVVRVEGGKLLG